MRETAAKVIAKLFQKSPNVVIEAIPYLFKALEDSDPHVRKSVVEAIVELVKVSPGLAGDVMSSPL